MRIILWCAFAVLLALAAVTGLIWLLYRSKPQ
jgi:hypothetical protein